MIFCAAAGFPLVAVPKNRLSDISAGDVSFQRPEEDADKNLDQNIVIVGCPYSYKERIEAVQLYLKCDHSISSVRMN